MRHLTSIPLGLEGALYRSSMPYRRERGELLDEAVARGVRVVVPLVSRDECLAKSGRDLYAEYAARGFTLRAFPLEDFGVPGDLGAYYATVDAVHADLVLGRSALVHCFAGIGRTGTFIACLARRVLDVDAREAVAWVRALVPGAVETRPQYDVVAAYRAADRART